MTTQSQTSQQSRASSFQEKKLLDSRMIEFLPISIISSMGFSRIALTASKSADREESRTWSARLKSQPSCLMTPVNPAVPHDPDDQIDPCPCCRCPISGMLAARSVPPGRGCTLIASIHASNWMDCPSSLCCGHQRFLAAMAPIPRVFPGGLEIGLYHGASNPPCPTRSATDGETCDPGGLLPFAPLRSHS